MKLTLLLLFATTFYNCSTDEILNPPGTTEVFTIHSDIINDNYPIYVYLPEIYNSDSSNQLIIALDGDTRFNSITDIIATQTQNHC